MIQQENVREALKRAAKPLVLPELLGALQKMRGAEFVTFVARVDPGCLVKHRETKVPFPYPGLTKVSRVNGIIGFRYTNSVNNQREREGLEKDFVAQPRKWGIHMYDGPNMTPLVFHKGKTYLEVKVQRVLDTRYEWQNRVIPAEELEGYLPAKRESSRQGVENLVILRDYDVNNIEEITMQGQTYRTA